MTFFSLGASCAKVKHKKLHYECPKHGGQTVEVPEDVDVKPYCPLCRKEARDAQPESVRYEKALKTHLAEGRMTQRRIQLLFPMSNLETVDSTFSFDNWTASTQEQERVLFLARRFAERFTERELQRVISIELNERDYFKKNAIGLFFVGKSGTGKTHLANAILAKVREQGVGSIYITAPELIEAYSSLCDAEKTRARQALSNLPLLILDEIGRQRDYSKDKAFVWTLIDNRIRFGRPTVFVTNFDSEEISRAFDESLKSRLKSSVYQLSFPWDGQRKRINDEPNPEVLF